MKEQDRERLRQIQHRINDCSTYNFGMRNADKLAHEDAQWMLDRIKELEKPEEGFVWVPNLSEHWANRGGW